MRKKTLGFLAFTLASAIMTSLMFSGVVTGPPTQPPEPPVEFDVNVKNTPLPVEVTKPIGMPIATNYTHVHQGAIVTGTDLDYAGHFESEVVQFDDETIVFTGGSVTGQVTFSGENGAGAASPTAWVEVVKIDGGEHMFALPFNSVCRVEHVDYISVKLFVFNPALSGSCVYIYDLYASLFWFVED